MAHKVTTPQSLQLRTLSGTFESARTVCRILKIDTISTTNLLKQRLAAIGRDPELCLELISALDRLNADSATLGNTTLINPAEHPLVVRSAMREPKGK